MAKREYGQYCGLARAAEILGQRWTLLIMRDVLVGPKRYSDLAAGLPGIPSNLLSTRLKELEHDGLIRREARAGTERSIVYTPTERGAELEPVLDTIARWGAADMHEPREHEIVTEASLVSALRSALQPEAPSTGRTVFVVHAGEASAHAIVEDGVVRIGPGPAESPDLEITACPKFRDLLAGIIEPASAETEGTVELSGDPDLLNNFVTLFHMPYTKANS
ncbi:MAG TPA: helix-turn-helix domain-containing protein [Enteractinococcus sp.]